MYNYRIVRVNGRQDGYCLDFNSGIVEAINQYAAQGWKYVGNIPARVMYTTDLKCGTVTSIDLVFEKEE